MSLELCLYLIDVVGNVGCILFGIIFLGTISLGVSFFVYEAEYGYHGSDDKFLVGLRKAMKIIFAVLCFAIPIKTLIPSMTTMYMISGAHYMNKTDIPEKVYKLLESKLDESLEATQKMEKQLNDANSTSILTLNGENSAKRSIIRTNQRFYISSALHSS
jgi:hypothetical protein